MRKSLLIASAVLLVTALAAPSVFAEGGKNRGAKGQGTVVQVQERNSDRGTPPVFPTR